MPLTKTWPRAFEGKSFAIMTENVRGSMTSFQRAVDRVYRVWSRASLSHYNSCAPVFST